MRPLTRRDWPLVERLFGPRGACGGCWCMYWRVPGGKAWEAAKGEPNRRALRRLVTGGGVAGVLALSSGEPVGWCCLGPKRDFSKLERSRVLRTDAAPDAWAVTCFFVPAPWRGHGVATALLRGAVELARARGVRLLEGYPVEPRAARVPAAFAWTGVPAVFESAGFRALPDRAGQRPVYVRRLRPRRRA